MLLYQLGLLLILLPVCSFAPGFFFVRKLRWSPLEKLCGSIGLSLILLYLASWGIYCVGARGNRMPVHAAPFVVISLVCAAMGAACWRDIVRLGRVTSVRRALAGYGFLLLWTALLMAIIRNYSGAAWFGDWLEHFLRTLFFLQHFPAGTPIFPGYAVPARPPMMNVLAAFFLAQTTDRFELFQAVFTFFNLLLFLPCCLMMPALGRRKKRRTWLLVLLFATSPLVMQNTTYSWTKAAAAFYVVLALWFYLAGWRKRDRVRTTAAFVALAAGLLVHYSAGPYVAILTLHYLIRVFPRRPNKWRELAGITAICGLLLGTWLFWSLAVYGPGLTFTSNSTVTLSQQYAGGTGEKIAANLFDSVVPVVVREPSLLDRYDGQRTAGKLRDWFFVFYQVNLIFGMGLVGGPLVVWLAYRALRRKRKREPERKAGRPPARGKRPAVKVPPAVTGVSPERQFWLILIGAGVLLGIAVVGERDPQGAAHLTMLSLQALGLSMLAAVVPWRRRSLAILILAGCAVDFSCGVLLQARVESLENTAQSIVFPGMEFAGGSIETAAPGPDSLSHSAWNNWFVKHQIAAYYWWLRYLDQRYGGDPAFQAILPRYEKTVEKAQSDDAIIWQGWFERHGGEVEFLGDHAAGSSGMGTNLATALLLALFLGLAGGVFRRTS
jgi:hypothetical protein